LLKDKVTIIIVVHNSQDVIGRCVSQFRDSGIRTLIIDNASEDGSARIAECAMPSIEVMHTGGNLGYARGNNLGLKRTRTEFALILNPDVLITLDAINRLVSTLEAYPDVAMVGPLVNDTNECGDPIVRSKKVSSMAHDIATRKLVYQTQEGDRVFAGFITGAVFLARKAYLEAIGFFDENFFMFEEDADLCRRAVQAGFRIICLTSVEAVHLGNQSSHVSLRHLYRRAWHLDGWSLLYHKAKKKGFLRARKTALTRVVKYFFRGVLYMVFKNREGLVRSVGALSGSFAFLIGQKAFKKTCEPRG
jgi:GT2 family glycosyltransferase